jgi:hypothetical protein
MIRFYKYLIYRLYTWRLRKKDNTPFTTTELLMCSFHYFHLLTLNAFITYFFPKMQNNFNKLQVVLIAAGIQLLYHLLVYNKEKWLKYVEEFQSETSEQRKRGTLFIWVYAIGSIVLFFMSVPLLFWARH